jgi:phage terminase large subunit-like protein
MTQDGDTEEGPDPNDVRRHAKRMYTEMQYRQKFRRFDFYRPNPKQLEFHNTLGKELMLRAGNQLGKTHAVGAQVTMDALSMYPDWYAGRRYIKPPVIERSIDFLGWAACTSSLKTRDGAQTKLLGNLNEDGQAALGTGLVPLDNIIGRPTMARGIGNLVDTVTLTREIGGKAVIQFKSYEQGRQAFEGSAVDEIWLDEDIKGDENPNIYGECIARLTTTRGQIRMSMTPMLGLTWVRRRYKSGDGGAREILMTIEDCLVSKGGHIPDEDLASIITSTPENKRQTRLYGADMQGEGAVFETPVEDIKHNLSINDVPPEWPWLWGLDFRHSGSISTGHPFAAVLGAWDRSTDRIYIMYAVRMLGLAADHVKAIRSHMMGAAPAAWPHDGGRGGSIISGETIAVTYKKLGLTMRPTHAVFPTGGYDFEAGITEMENRFASKRLLIARNLPQAFDEYQGYHRVNGLVNKIDDDILSAIRVLCMDIRYAKTTQDFYVILQHRMGRAVGFAVGSPLHPDGDGNIFG